MKCPCCKKGVSMVGKWTVTDGKPDLELVLAHDEPKEKVRGVDS